MSYSKSLQDWGEREFPRVKSRRSQRGSGSNYYSNRVLGLRPLAYWPLNELGGTKIVDISGNGYNGTYTAASLGQTGIGDGGTATAFDGSTSFGNVFSAALQGAFSNQEGTLNIWLRAANAGVWTDATARYFTIFQADANNSLSLRKSVTNNNVICTYVAGATNKNVTITTFNDVLFHALAITYSKSGDAVKVYLDGVQQGATQTGLGTWSGSLAATTCVIGAQTTTPAAVWNGSEAHVSLFTRALSAAEVKSIATI